MNTGSSIVDMCNPCPRTLLLPISPTAHIRQQVIDCVPDFPLASPVLTDDTVRVYTGHFKPFLDVLPEDDHIAPSRNRKDVLDEGPAGYLVSAERHYPDPFEESSLCLGADAQILLENGRHL
jgi:hypothetical protein